MRRLFWLGIGLTVGALAFRKLNQLAQRATPKGIAQSLGAGLAELSEAIRDFALDVRESMSEHEQEMRTAAGLDSGMSANEQVTTQATRTR